MSPTCTSADASRAALAILERGPSGEVYTFPPTTFTVSATFVMVVCELLGRDFSKADPRGRDSREAKLR